MPVELIVVIVAVLVVFSLVMAMLSRVKKCPSDKVMVIYGKVGKNPDGSSKSAKCIHGGAAFVLPLVQSYQYLDLTPISIQVDLTNAAFASEHTHRCAFPFYGRYINRAGDYAECGRTPAWPAIERDPGAFQGHHLWSASSHHRYNGYRGNQYRPR